MEKLLGGGGVSSIERESNGTLTSCRRVQASAIPAVTASPTIKL